MMTMLWCLAIIYGSTGFFFCHTQWLCRRFWNEPPPQDRHKRHMRSTGGMSGWGIMACLPVVCSGAPSPKGDSRPLGSRDTHSFMLVRTIPTRLVLLNNTSTLEDGELLFPSLLTNLHNDERDTLEMLWMCLCLEIPLLWSSNCLRFLFDEMLCSTILLCRTCFDEFGVTWYYYEWGFDFLNRQIKKSLVDT